LVLAGSTFASNRSAPGKLPCGMYLQQWQH
jgi:hypothetical protein